MKNKNRPKNFDFVCLFHASVNRGPQSTDHVLNGNHMLNRNHILNRYSSGDEHYSTDFCE